MTLTGTVSVITPIGSSSTVNTATPVSGLSPVVVDASTLTTEQLSGLSINVDVSSLTAEQLDSIRGPEGYSPDISVGEKTDGKTTLTITHKVSGVETETPVEIDDGEDGISPTLSAEEIKDDDGENVVGYTVKYTDKDHTAETELLSVYNGIDGVSPTISYVEVDATENKASGYTIQYTDKDHQTATDLVTIYNGKDGTGSGTVSSVNGIEPTSGNVVLKTLTLKQGTEEYKYNGATDTTIDISPVITIDDELSDTGTNAVQGKVIKSAIDEKLDKPSNNDSGSTGQALILDENKNPVWGNVQSPIVIDDELTDNGTNAVEGGVIKSAIDAKLDKPTDETSMSSGQVLALDDDKNPIWKSITVDIDVDGSLSDSSENPVQNKVLYSKFADCVTASEAVGSVSEIENTYVNEDELSTVTAYTLNEEKVNITDYILGIIDSQLGVILNGSYG